MAFIQACPGCGMPREDWQGNGGQGVERDRQTFCCAGCANGSGCTCQPEEHAAGRLGQDRDDHG